MFFIVHPLRRIESKDLPGYFIVAERDSARVRKWPNYALTWVSPGNSGQNGSVSFQTFDNRWLMDNGSLIVAASYDHTRRFKRMSTFIVSNDKWFSGCSVVQSVVNSSRFLRHSGKRLMMSEPEDSILFRNSSCWKITERGISSI